MLLSLDISNILVEVDYFPYGLLVLGMFWMLQLRFWEQSIELREGLHARGSWNAKRRLTPLTKHNSS